MDDMFCVNLHFISTDVEMYCFVIYHLKKMISKMIPIFKQALTRPF